MYTTIAGPFTTLTVLMPQAFSSVSQALAVCGVPHITLVHEPYPVLATDGLSSVVDARKCTRGSADAVSTCGTPVTFDIPLSADSIIR